jgi:hypothetical protein
MQLAVVGIGRIRWESVTPEESKDQAHVRRIMKKRQFDVLPIDPSKGKVCSYFIIKTWGDYSEINKREITYDNLIPQRTSLKSVIRSFAGDRLFFFLTNGRQVTGLISVVNLNCLQARTYLFSLVSELEIKIGEILMTEIDNNNMTVEYILNEANDKVSENYEKDKKENIEGNIVE